MTTDDLIAGLPGEALVRRGLDDYARYNAFLGELVSFEMALDRRVRALERA